MVHHPNHPLLWQPFPKASVAVHLHKLFRGNRCCEMRYRIAAFERSRDAESNACLVRALGLNVSRLLALVTDLFARGRSLRAIPRKVTILATVVALAAVHALARHVAVTTARVAGFTAALAALTTIARVTKASVGVSAVGVRTVAGDVADLATLVAFLRATGLAAERTAALRAVAANVAGLTTSIAGLGILRPIRAFAANMAFAATVVALRRSTVRAVPELVSSLAACLKMLDNFPPKDRPV
ncbi:hypothetical protein F5B19DRAFT_465102 [Rostrohypoxylon terebratum]|nr:hypothetical protein F5B19DRAFT_465102 [Rostrohypoxylon terebratum]